MFSIQIIILKHKKFTYVIKFFFLYFKLKDYFLNLKNKIY